MSLFLIWLVVSVINYFGLKFCRTMHNSWRDIKWTKRDRVLMGSLALVPLFGTIAAISATFIGLSLLLDSDDFSGPASW